MARTKARDSQAASQAKCTCNWGYAAVALILFTLSLYLLVAGFSIQFNSVSRFGDGSAGAVLAMYFIGLLIGGLGKRAKCEACKGCRIHG